MIPWVREKLAERRAKWLQARKRAEIPALDDIGETDAVPVPVRGPNNGVIGIERDDDDDAAAPEEEFGQEESQDDYSSNTNSNSNRSNPPDKQHSKLEIRKRSQQNAPNTTPIKAPPQPKHRSTSSSPQINRRPNKQPPKPPNSDPSRSTSHIPSFLNRKLFTNKSKVAGGGGSSLSTAAVPTELRPRIEATQIELVDIKRDNSSRVNNKHHHPASSTSSTTITSTSPPSSTNNSNSHITIRVISIKGGFIDVNLPITKTAKELKLEAISRFAVDTNSLPLYAPNLEHIVNKYKLVTIDQTDVIDENATLERLQLKNKDELLLVVKRTFDLEAKRRGELATEAAEESELRGPSYKDVLEATEHIEPTQTTPPKVNIDDMVLQTDLQYDIRKILISLAQSSAYVIGAGPYADRLILMLKQRLINRRKNDTDSLDCLVDMGFTKDRVVYALNLKNNVYADALRWLIENPRFNPPPADGETDGFIEIPLNMDSEKEGDDTESMQLEHKRMEFSERKDHIETLLEMIRIHAQRDLPVCEEMVGKLVEMGFEENDVKEALKITQNNQAAACEWLIGSRSKSLTELRDGLPYDSPILKALLSSPQVQISLGNPKMLLAYLSMLDNYSSMNMWLSDTDTSGVLGHILRTYHEEKHIVAINQFSSVL